MAAILDPKLIGGGAKNPYQTPKAVASNPINSAITAAVAAKKPVAVPSLPGMNSQKTVPSITPAATVQPSPTPVTTTTNPAPKTAAPMTGALNYNTATTAQKQGMQDNWARLNSDSDYLASEIARAQAKIAAPGTTAQELSAANDYLTKLTGISSGSVTPGTNGFTSASKTNNFGLPSDLSWLGSNANNEIAAQIAAYQGQQEAARQAAQFGVDQNKQYLSEQIDQLQRQQAVAQDALQQQQNRFGGLYSGGLNYQGGQINSSFAQQQGALERDIAARNQQLLDQYGNQANTIAQNIQQLQSNAPGIIRDRIQSYLDNYANTYGYNPLNPNQSTQAGKTANLNAALAVGQQTGYNVSPQTDYNGLFRQVAQGTDANGKPLTLTAAQTQQNIDNVYRDQQAAITNAYQAGQLSLDQAKFELSQLESDRDEAYRRYTIENSGAGGTEKYEGLSPNQVLDNIINYYGGVDEDLKPTGKIDPAKKGDAFLAIVDAGLSDAQTKQLLTVSGYTKDEINKYMKQYGTGENFNVPSLNKNLGGVFQGTGDAINKYADQYGVDPLLATAIMMWETGRGTSSAAKNKNNVGGMMGKNGLMTFDSIDDGIEAMIRNLSKNYIKQGLTTIPQIQKKYAPVGASNDPTGLNNNWVKGVTSIYNELKGAG